MQLLRSETDPGNRHPDIAKVAEVHHSTAIGQPLTQGASPVGALKILSVGRYTAGRDRGCVQRLYALRELGHTVEHIDSPFINAHPPVQRLVKRIRKKIFNSLVNPSLNKKILGRLNEECFDILWIDKGVSVAPATLKAAKVMHPSMMIVGYAPDDMMRRGNQSRHFVRGLGSYDLFFTTKSYNVQELKEAGCPEVRFVDNAFDSCLHRPVEPSARVLDQVGAAVGFVGNAELERAKSIAYLAGNGVPVDVWGIKWEKYRKRLKADFRIAGSFFFGEPYVELICSYDICLCFLRKINRDLQTMRSIEIPACGVFMLAERTDEHQHLFEEGKEAEYFSSDEELLAKARFYLAHAKERKRIAMAGRERCVRSGYSNHDRLADMLRQVVDMREKTEK